VVELRGLELAAKHAVYTNRSPGGDNSKGSDFGTNYVRVTAADSGDTGRPWTSASLPGLSYRDVSRTDLVEPRTF
jgi:hypothetical protein